MSTIEPFFKLFDLDTTDLTHEERMILEAEIFIHLYDYFQQQHADEYKPYCTLLRLDKNKENEMLNSIFASHIMKDLMDNEGYTIEGIATYTNTSIEIVEQIYDRRFENPPIHFFYRLLTLHRSIRHQLYLSILEKLRSRLG